MLSPPATSRFGSKTSVNFFPLVNMIQNFYILFRYILLNVKMG